ncbi:MAG: ABC transporter ATP-binding protein [Candidatus Shapirobacteria bacterium]|nr:ABC transporter ATP-binding protein [Candidatus Shapirobacteria bacterium]
MMETTKTTIIEVKNLNKTFEVKSTQIPVLKDINVEIKKGEFIIITGPSGCGKSTLLHILLGLEPPSSGSVVFLGNNLYGGMTEDERTEVRKTEVGMVYQQPNWIKALTVLENVMFALRINGETDEDARKKAIEVLTMVGMDKWQDYIPTELSSGQQQKVALGRAVVTNPQIIIADEPTGNLDFKSGQELMELLKKLNNENRTIIMVTHDLEYLTFATRSFIMFDGKIVGSAHEHELAGKLGGFKKLMASVTKQ